MPIHLLYAFLFILFLSNHSYAGIYNHMEVLVGEKAAGMGGAFTAIADDTTATYYNPAGIVQIPFNRMSASANAVTFKTREGKFFIEDNEKLTSFDFIPNFWGVVISTSLGKFGFSIVVPESDNFELHEKYSDVSLLGYTWNTAREDITIEADTYLIGPSYAISILPGLSAGVSLYFLYNTFTENIYNFWDTDYIDVDDGLSYSFLLENSRGLNGSGTGITGKAGFLYKINDNIQFSLVFRPLTMIAEEVKVRQVAYQSNINENNVVKSFERGNVEGSVSFTRKRPYASTIGVAYLPLDRMTIAMDVSYYGSAEYLEKAKAIGDNFEAVDTQRKIIFEEVVNGNIGVEYMLTSSIPFRAGIYTDLSAVPEVKDVDTPQATHLDKYGMTLSSGYMKSNSTVIAGVKYGIGRGYGTAPDYSENEIDFKNKKEPYTQTDVVLFISGSYMF